jgi:hypothetical protein
MHLTLSLSAVFYSWESAVQEYRPVLGSTGQPVTTPRPTLLPLGHPAFPPTRIDTGWASALRSIRAHSIIRGPLSPRIGHTHIGMVRTGRAVTTIARRAVRRRAKVGRYSLVSPTCQVQKPMLRPSSIRLDLSGLFLYCHGGSK